MKLNSPTRPQIRPKHPEHQGKPKKQLNVNIKKKDKKKKGHEKVFIIILDGCFIYAVAVLQKSTPFTESMMVKHLNVIK